MEQGHLLVHARSKSYVQLKTEGKAPFAHSTKQFWTTTTIDRSKTAPTAVNNSTNTPSSATVDDCFIEFMIYPCWYHAGACLPRRDKVVLEVSTKDAHGQPKLWFIGANQNRFFWCDWVSFQFGNV